METKTCTKCGTTKPIEQYYKSPGYRGGRHTWCIQCIRQYYHERYTEHREEIIAKNKEYMRTHREIRNKIEKNNKQKHPEQIKARQKIRWAVESGKMPSPKTLHCKICGESANVYHHWSYLPEHWYDVIPLCNHCHGSLHKGVLTHPDVPKP